MTDDTTRKEELRKLREVAGLSEPISNLVRGKNKNVYFLVMGPHSRDTTLGDMVVELDVIGLENLIKGSPSNAAVNENWELYTHREGAIADARRRMGRSQWDQSALSSSPVDDEDGVGILPHRAGRP